MEEENVVPFHVAKKTQKRKNLCIAISIIVVVCLITLAILLPIYIYSSALIKPKALQKGDTVGFLSLASPPLYIYSNETEYKQHVEMAMQSLGLKVKFAKNAFVEDKYFAGNASVRVSEFHEMLKDKDVKWIISNRGGYGCNTLLELFDYHLIATNAKGIQGYSDITSCMQAIQTESGVIPFHGPMGIDDWIGTDNSKWFQLVAMQGEKVTFVNSNQFNNTFTIYPGKAKGRTIGGNLSLIMSLLGTKFLSVANCVGKILFLEDVGETPERIDRMMSNLKLSGCLGYLKGFVWGQCTGCEPSNPSRSFTVPQVITRYIEPLKIPSYYGAQIGHISSQFTIPIGLNVEIDANNYTITLLESPVS